MNTVHKIEKWGDSHHPMVLDLIRIGLGVFLALKGLAFMQNSAYLEDLIVSQHLVAISGGVLMAIVYYVTFAHLVGGTLIAIGVLTRPACLVQLPIVLAAVFLTDFFQSSINSLQWASIVALVLLVLFAVIGSGPLSLDKHIANWEGEK